MRAALTGRFTLFDMTFRVATTASGGCGLVFEIPSHPTAQVYAVRTADQPSGNAPYVVQRIH